jgi:hypothetical protein
MNSKKDVARRWMERRVRLLGLVIVRLNASKLGLFNSI